MSEAERIDGILSAIQLLFDARDAVMSKRYTLIGFFLFRRRIKQSRKLERVQAYLLDQIDLGGWNCFREVS